MFWTIDPLKWVSVLPRLKRRKMADKVLPQRVSMLGGGLGGLTQWLAGCGYSQVPPTLE